MLLVRFHEKETLIIDIVLLTYVTFKPDELSSNSSSSSLFITEPPFDNFQPLAFHFGTHSVTPTLTTAHMS